MSGPLAGVRVLELGVLIAGPFAGRLLADFGGEVITVEEPRPGAAAHGNLAGRLPRGHVRGPGPPARPLPARRGPGRRAGRPPPGPGRGRLDHGELLRDAGVDGARVRQAGPRPAAERDGAGEHRALER